MTIEGSTIRNNSAAGQGGGGIGNFGTLTVVNSTISANTDESTSGGGGGIGNAGTMTVKNSIVGNSTAGGDCVNLVTFSAEGDNFDTDGTCAALDAAFTQVTGGQLALGPLTENGGPTRTHALLAGSVALEAAADCSLLDGITPVTEDQRGIARPQGAACDVGAFEAELEGPVSVLEIPTATGWGLLLLALALAGAALPMLRR